MEERKLTFEEKLGVLAALLMFFGVGGIMGGSASGNDKVFFIGAIIFSIGSIIALYLLFKYKPKEKQDF